MDEDEDDALARSLSDLLFPPALPRPRGRGLFQLLWARDPQVHHVKEVLQAKLSEIAAQTDQDNTQNQTKLYALNTVDGEREGSARCLSGMMSYPNFRWVCLIAHVLSVLFLSSSFSASYASSSELRSETRKRVVG